MGTQLSPARLAYPILEGPGLELVSRGKVRDTYLLTKHNLYLSVATDAISIFDFTLDATVPEKGIVLNAMSHYFLALLERHDIRTHLVAAGSAIDTYLPDNLRGKGDYDLWARAVVVKKLKMIPVEFIARGFLTGSGLSAYKKDQHVCGHWLPSGLQDGDRLPYVLDTPTDKAEIGHDEHLNAEEIRAKYPEATYLLLKAFQIASSHALKSGNIIADTKLEFGHDDEGNLILADEAFTPDSSRFWALADWEATQRLEKRKAPAPNDKQLVRNWGLGLKINERNPESEQDVAWVHNQTIPGSLIEATAQTYRYIFWRLCGATISSYCVNPLRTSIGSSPKKIAVIFGSESDITDEVRNCLRAAAVRHVQSGELKDIAVHVISCHRHPAVLHEFAVKGCDGADAVIGAGGKAFAQPGVMDAWIHYAGLDIPVIGVAIGNPGTESYEAAILSIKEIPGQPVILDEFTGKPYEGTEGLTQAISRVAIGELPPLKLRKTAEAKLNIEI